MKEKIISLILCLAIVSSMFGVFTAPIAAQYDYVYLDVYANDPDGNPIDHADVFINDTWVGFTGEYFMVPNGSINKVFIQDLWEAGNTGYRYSVNRWEDSSTANPRNVVCTELETQITAYFGEKWCPGDVDGNCVVDDTDKSILVAAYGASRGDPDWDSRADVNGDGIVDIYDVPIVLTHYGYVYSKSEIRYMRGNTTTVNNLTAYQLSTNQSDTAKYNTYGGYGSCSVWWGIRVWERSSAGTETEITGGTPVALVSRSTSGEGIQSANMELLGNQPQHNRRYRGSGLHKSWSQLVVGSSHFHNRTTRRNKAGFSNMDSLLLHQKILYHSNCWLFLLGNNNIQQPDRKLYVVTPAKLSQTL